MSDPIRPVGAAGGGAADSGSADPSDASDSSGNGGRGVPIVAGRATTHAPDAKPGDAAFAAQLLGGPPRRGLKGGQETLDEARSTYLGTEYSGPNDRRPKKGIVRKTDV